MRSLYIITIIVLTGCGQYNPSIDTPNATQKNSDEKIESNIMLSKKQSETNLIIPGKQVGDITGNTSRIDLVNLFPPNLVKITDIQVLLGEGETASGTKVEISPENTFTVVWKNEEKTKIDHIRDFSILWHLPEEIHVGTRWSNLQEKLGEFNLFGFGWDYGGTLDLNGTPLEKYQNNLIIRVQPSDKARSKNSQAINSVSGDTLFPSTNPNLAQLDLRVSEIIVFFDSL